MGVDWDLSFDYTVIDSKGIRGVKDGKETPISAEEWEKAHPEHRNTGCKECTFVPDTGTLLAFNVPKEVRDKANQKPKFVGKFTMPNWTGHSGFYIFLCPNCDEVRVDYPHGYCENGHLYIRCDRCRFRVVLYSGEYRDIYRRENVVAPPTFWEELKIFWKNRKKVGELRKAAVAEVEKAEEMGVKVVEDADDLF